MSNLIPVVGYVSPAKPGYSSILTLDGTQFELQDEAIVKRFPLDTNAQGAVRLFIKADAPLLVSLKASDLFGGSAPAAQLYYKYKGDVPYHPKLLDGWHNPSPKDPPDDRIVR